MIGDPPQVGEASLSGIMVRDPSKEFQSFDIFYKNAGFVIVKPIGMHKYRWRNV